MKKIAIFGILSVFGLMLAVPVTMAQSPTQDTPGRKQIKQELRQEMRQNVAERVRGKAAKIVGGKITSINGSVLTVEKDGTSYSVNTASNTQLRRHFWGKSDLNEFAVGNIVNVWGTWADDTKTVINARLIRNTSIQKRRGVFMGTIKSKGTDTFVLTSLQRGDQTVVVTSSTKLVGRRNQTIIFADLQTGHKVQVKGLWDKSQNKVTEVTHVKDFNLPPQPTAAAGI